MDELPEDEDQLPLCDSKAASPHTAILPHLPLALDSAIGPSRFWQLYRCRHCQLDSGTCEHLKGTASAAARAAFVLPAQRSLSLPCPDL